MYGRIIPYSVMDERENLWYICENKINIIPKDGISGQILLLQYYRGMNTMQELNCEVY